MGLLDMFRRKNSQPARSFVRFFNAAKVTESTSSWTTNPTSIDQKVYADLRSLRARSREQAVNNDYYRRYLAMLRSNVIGHKGVRLSSLVTMPKGGKEVPDLKARRAIESAWMDWGKDCDMRGSLSWVDLKAAVLNTVAVDGEAFIITHKTPGGGLKLELIDSELVDVTLRGDNITMGIEKDGAGRPVAYHLKGQSVGLYGYAVGDHQVIPADRMIHVFVQEYAGQTRGFPWCSSGLSILKQLDAYMEAAVVAARFGAAKMGFITTADGDFVGDDVDANGDPVIDGGDPGWYRLNPGEEVQEHDPAYPHEQFGEFVKTAIRRTASGLGVNYNLLANDYEGVSFSAMRHSINEDQEQWKAHQEWFIRSFIQPVFDLWLKRSLVHENITIGTAPLKLSRIDQYARVSWTPRRWGYIDPLKDINAKVMEIENGLDTRSHAIRERGMDPDDVWQEMASDEAQLDSLGLSIGAGGVPEVVDDGED